MKTIACWDDLSPFGIVPLTGEACGLTWRILCDVTAKGKQALEKTFGVAEIKLQEAWNRGTPEDPHVGSVMLAPELLPVVGVFALLEDGCREVWLTKGRTLTAIEQDEAPEVVQNFRQVYADRLVRRFAYAGTAGDRNVHMMSGRVQ